MLTPELLNSLKTYTQSMQQSVSFAVQVGEHVKKSELMTFLSKIASVSDRLSVTEVDQADRLRSPISFALAVEGELTGVVFSGIPGGHEFNSLILAVLHLSGTPMKLDESIVRLIEAIDQPLTFEVVVSLSCHNCPDVVQSLNQFAVINPQIRVETLDGGCFPEWVEAHNIQGVPAVRLNGEPFIDGKVDTAKILEKLTAQFPELLQTEPAESLPLQDVVVMGGGPAGVAAAVYVARKGLQVTLVADRLGGQVKDTMGIENFISMPKTTGPELVAGMESHLADYDIRVKQHVKVDQVTAGETHTVHLSSGECISTRSIIIATGAQWRELGVPGERENIGQGVAYCPHCDGPFFKGKDVAVIGGGNSGIEAALDLSGIVKHVTVFEFASELKADPVLIQRAVQKDNIDIITYAATQEILADNGRVVALRYQQRDTELMKELDIAAVFIQIGLVPNSQSVKEVVALSKYGEILINETCETDVPGIFACGDVTTVPYKQIVTAMGEGAKAGLSVFDYLSAHETAI